MIEHANWIVVEDPENQYYEGSLVEAQRARVLASRGVALLPVIPDSFKKGAAAGYFKRAWGSGWPLDALYPKMTAQTTLFCEPTLKGLHWVARVVPTEAFLALSPEQRQGQLQITSDTGQRTPYNASVKPTTNPVLVRELPPLPDASRGWIIGGRATIACQVEGHYGFALYGHAPGLRTLWAALSTTSGSDER